MTRYLKTLTVAGFTNLLVLTGCVTNHNPAQGSTPSVAIDVEAGDITNEDNPLYHLRTPYVGAAHATSAIVNALPLPGEDWLVASIQIGADHGDFPVSYSPYTLTIFYEPRKGSVIDGQRDMMAIPTDAFESNSLLLFDLIENLQAVTFFVRFTSSGGNETESDTYNYRWSRTRHGEYSLQIAKTNVQIDTLSDEERNSLPKFHEFDYRNWHIANHNIDDVGVEIFDRLIISTSNTVRDFQIITIGHDFHSDRVYFLPQEVMHSIPYLFPDTPLVIDSFFTWGTMPLSGISFIDGDTRRYFTIIQDQRGLPGDPPYSLAEFEVRDDS
ncbi:MAG: DUF4825 domain-containing protein [Defluviitaleaceae bacterium]|nr:DUF4825 domain-containing protein [Defluviitaleaceae bacterium]